MCKTDNCTTSSLDGTTTEMTMTSEIPPEMRFTENNILTIAVYSILCVVAVFGNLTVFGTLYINHDHLRSRINLFIVHLSIADLFIALITMPLEIGWHVTVQWKAGDLACRILMFFRPLGFYLSSFILVAISIDRYCAIAHPMSLQTAERRGRAMLTAAWTLSIISSIPQSIIFHVESHPDHPWFTQCVTFNFFPSRIHELVYNLFTAVAMYGLPLVVIMVSYALIICMMSNKARQQRHHVADRRLLSELHAVSGKRSHETTLVLTLRSRDADRIQQARMRTLKMTIVIVSVFVVCWTPYTVISLWWWFDQDSAEKIHPLVAKSLLLLAVSHSCVDPIVYDMSLRQTEATCTHDSVCKKSLPYSFPSVAQQYHYQGLQAKNRMVCLIEMDRDLMA